MAEGNKSGALPGYCLTYVAWGTAPFVQNLHARITRTNQLISLRNNIWHRAVLRQNSGSQKKAWVKDDLFLVQSRRLQSRRERVETGLSI